MRSLHLLALCAMLGSAGCAHINPGQIVLSCAMDAANDPSIKGDVIAALNQADWRGALDSLIGKVPGLTSEVVACVLESLVKSVMASPNSVTQARASMYLTEHGYSVN